MTHRKSGIRTQKKRQSEQLGKGRTEIKALPASSQWVEM